MEEVEGQCWPRYFGDSFKECGRRLEAIGEIEGQGRGIFWSGQASFRREFVDWVDWGFGRLGRLKVNVER